MRAICFWSLSQGFLVLEKILYDPDKIVIGLVILGATVAVLLLVGILSYREEAVLDHINRRIREERPWLFEDTDRNS